MFILIAWMAVDESKFTRGMLIAPAITETALEMLKSSGFEFFNLEFEISNPKAKIKGLEKRQPTINEFLK